VDGPVGRGGGIVSEVSFLRDRRNARTVDAASGPMTDDQRLTADMTLVARGDEDAFARVYDVVAGPVYGMILRVLRDPAQSEEVAQEVLVEVWRQATRFDASRGSVKGWVLTMAHRRAVDRVRSAQSATDRETKVAWANHQREFDEVAEEVEQRMESEQVRRSLGVLTELQREAIQLAYYGGYTHREVSELLDVPLGTIKTRLRDGLIRLRDEMGVSA
jgi:RNA polymerase sigma-70 factor (ECF subfamily)